MIATMLGADGSLLTRQRVEWMLAADGAGVIMSPGQREPLEILNCIRGLPKKVDSRYAINNTHVWPMTLDRGTPTPTDDILVQPGQAWISVTSPTEGISRVTAFAAEVFGWDRRQQTATIYWVDAQWRFPAHEHRSRRSAERAVVTSLTRQTDSTPLAGWIVRYEITGGPEAGFAPDGTGHVDVVTNPAGEASAEMFQKQPIAGTNSVQIQIIRPAGFGGRRQFRSRLAPARRCKRGPPKARLPCQPGRRS